MEELIWDFRNERLIFSMSTLTFAALITTATDDILIFYAFFRASVDPDKTAQKSRLIWVYTG